MELPKQFLIRFIAALATRSPKLAIVSATSRTRSSSCAERKNGRKMAVTRLAERQMCVAELSIKLFREFWRTAQLRFNS